MSNDKVIMHNANELWTIASIIKSDFPKLKKLGYKFASIIEGHNCECFVCGWKQRARAVNDAIINDGIAYDINSKQKLF